MADVFVTKQEGLNERGRIVDWYSGNEIRRTDNSAKEGDWYGSDVNDVLYLDPSGAPYAQRGKLGNPTIGDGDKVG